jgi:CDP-2,3-bis-(O-geranylgeranyl)-sn-glycerol synthase
MARNGSGESRGKTSEHDAAFNKNVKIAKFMLVAFLIILGTFILIFSMVFSISDFLVILGLSMLFIGPAYIANAMMVFTSDGRPIDGGKNFIDGKRLFGQTKTWGGFIGGVIFGFLAALLFNFLFFWNFPAIAAYAGTQSSYLKYISINYLQTFLNPALYLIPIRAFFCGLGSPLGDLIKSFIKRRLSIGSGKPFWIADQLDFIVATILLNLAWFPIDIFIIILLLIMTPAITLTANNVAFFIGKKTEPW